MEPVTYEMILDSLCMSHWKQASTYMNELVSEDLQEQIKWIHENEPEQLVGFTKWIAREFQQYKRDTNFEFYGTLKDVIKNVMNKIEIKNRSYFDYIEANVKKYIDDDDLGDIEKEYILKMVERFLIEYYIDLKTDSIDLLTELLDNPFGQYRNIQVIGLYSGTYELIADLLESQETEIRPFLCLLNYYLPDYKDTNFICKKLNWDFSIVNYKPETLKEYADNSKVFDFNRFDSFLKR